jgi:hypothetical protein
MRGHGLGSPLVSIGSVISLSTRWPSGGTRVAWIAREVTHSQAR